MSTKILFALVGVALGWALTELGLFLRLRREDRRLEGPILTDLLEIRHRLFVLDAGIKEISKEIPFSTQDKVQLQRLVLTLFPEPPEFLERYEEALSALARIDPIRAFRLRGQPLIAPFLAQFQSLAATQTDSEIWTTIVQPELLARVKPHIEELILDVACAHSWRSWWQARKLLRKPTLSEADRKWISDVIEKLKKAGGRTIST